MSCLRICDRRAVLILQLLAVGPRIHYLLIAIAMSRYACTVISYPSPAAVSRFIACLIRSVVYFLPPGSGAYRCADNGGDCYCCCPFCPCYLLYTNTSILC